MRQTRIVEEVLCPVVVGCRPEIQALELALAGALAGEVAALFSSARLGLDKSPDMRAVADGRRPAAAGRAGRAVPASPAGW